MTRKKIKLAWLENKNSRAVSLKKRRLGLSKKVQELTLLCDVRAFIIMFSPNESEPMVWPSVETARVLLDDFLALPEFERRKKETNLQSYIEEKTRKVQDQLIRSQKKIMEYLTDQLMVQLQHGRGVADLSTSEIYELLSYSKVKIMLCRKRLDFLQHPPLRDSPVHPFDVQFEEFRTIKNDERFMKTDETARRISSDILSDNKSHYLLDKWVCASELPTYQGSSSNGNTDLEMELTGPQGIPFYDFVGSVSQQPLQYYNWNNNSAMAISQPMQEEGSNINNGTAAREGNVNATSFEIKKVWSGLNNNHL